MTTINVYWFPVLGFRPGRIEKRKDFGGKYGWNEHLILSKDANVPYTSKYDSPYYWIEDTPITSSVAPTPTPVVPVHYPVEPPIHFYPPDIFCCSTRPPLPPNEDVPSVPLPATGLLLISCIMALCLYSRIR